MRAIHLSSKLHPSAYRSVTEMACTQEMQRVDRKLNLELAESPINPAFIHMSSPIPNGCDPLFYLKINGEALWKLLLIFLEIRCRTARNVVLYRC